MKGAVSWKKFLLFAHLGLLIGAIAAGRWLYAGALGQNDILAVVNPYPQVTMADNLAHCPINPYPQIQVRFGQYAANPFVYVRDWYLGMNGRLPVAIMDSLLAQAARLCPTPESFPWWLLRALSLYCLLAIPLNLMAAAGIWARRPAMALILTAAVWSIWIVSPNVYIFSVMFDIILTDRNIQGYVLSWMIMGAVNNWMGRSLWRWGLMGIGIVFVSSEQNLPSVPVLLLATGWLGLEANAHAGRDWFKQVFYYGAWTLLAAAIFFLSPGQHLRNVCCLPMNSIGTFSPLAWYRQVIDLGYGALFPSHPGPLWLWHLIFYCGLGLVMALWLIIRLKTASSGRPAENDSRELFGIGLMAFAFLTAFLVSMTTLIVSPYFPPYAACYPALFLATGLAFSFWFILDSAAAGMDALSAKVVGYRLISTKIGCTVALPILVTIALIRTITVPAWPAMSTGYRQIMEQNRNRHQVYAEIIKQQNTTGQRHFILMNLWKSPVWGLHMDDAWGRAGYFRWLKMEDIVCPTEDEWNAAGRPQEQLYFKLDCAKVIQDESNQKQ